MDEHTKWCIGLRSSGLYKEGVIDGSHLESLLVITERLPAPLVHIDHPEHQHCRHCEPPLQLPLNQLGLTTTPRKM